MQQFFCIFSGFFAKSIFVIVLVRYPDISITHQRGNVLNASRAFPAIISNFQSDSHRHGNLPALPA